MRYILVFICLCQLLAGAACQTGGLLPRGSNSEAAAPPPVNQGGVSLQVTGVGASGGVISLKFKAVNGNENLIRLANTYDHLLLRDDLGNEYPAKGEGLELQPLTANDLTVEFLGELPSGAKTLSLTTNTKSSNSSREPRIVIEKIPAPHGSAITFAPARNPPALTLDDKTSNHPNGTSFTVSQISFGDNTIDVSFLAVNGSRGDDKFSVKNNSTFLQDERANRYYLIPPPAGEMRLPQRQKMSGTLRFAGKPAPDVTKLALYLNDNYGGDNEYTTYPKIVIADIPVKK